MKVYTSLEFQWNGFSYQRVYEQSYDYRGPVDRCCGATSAQNQIEQSQMNLSNTAQQQASDIFGSDSDVFNKLLSTFSPTVAAGPSQQGYSSQELANLNSQAITANGQEARNAKQASGEQIAAQGGGNSVNPNGTDAAVDANINTAAATNTANDLSQIEQAGYEQGVKNYDTAVAGLEAAPGVFNSATAATNAATGAGSAAANTANQVASQNNSWVQGVTGALGGVLGSAVGGGGGLSNVFSGGSGAGSSVPSIGYTGPGTLSPAAGPPGGFTGIQSPLPSSPMPALPGV